MPVSSAIGRWIVLVPMLVAGCSAVDDGTSDAPTGPAIDTAPVTTLPLAETALDDPEETTVASVLAPSQVTASTAAPPPTPPPCTAADVELWTAAVRPSSAGDGASTVDAVIRVRNVSDDWCEPDIGRSPRLDPRIEPDVWLQPGDTADLVVGQEVEPCDAPVLVSSVQVGIGDTSVVVPSAVVTCGWWLTAFYPNDAASEPCAVGDLEAVATDHTVVVRNTSARSCRLDALASVDGEPLPEASAAPVPVDLYPGDVVAVGRLGDAACDGVASRAVRFGADAEVKVEAVPCAIEFDAAVPRPWYGAADGPAASLATDADIVEVLDALDPFGSRA
jgi:hypothetical protein